MRERWFGATGRRVPELAAEGGVDVERALVLEDVADASAIREAFDAGTPVVVRAGVGGSDKGGASRVPRWHACWCRADRRELLELDLTELTYG